MMRCKYWDCGWCYCKTGKSNDINGKCMTPKECQVLRDDVITLAVDMAQPQQNGDSQMTEQNIRDAFECSDRHLLLNMSKNSDGAYINSFTRAAYSTFKSGYIAAFKVILESKNE